MRDFSHKLWVKAVCMLLAVLTMLSMLVAGIGIVYFGQNDYYSNSKDSLQRQEMRALMEEENWRVAEAYWEGTLDFFEPSSGCYFYEIWSEDGKRLAGNYEGQTADLREETAIARSGEYLTIVGYLYPWASDDLFSQREAWVNFCYSMRYWIFAILGALAILLVFLLVILYSGAGYKEGEEAPQLSWLERIPFDLFTAFLLLLFFLELQFMQELYFSVPLMLCLLAFVLAIDAFLLLLYTVSFAARVKVGGFWRSTLIGMIFGLFWKGLKGLFSILGSLPLIWKSALLVAIASAIEFFILLFAPSRGTLMLWWFLGKILFVPLILYVAVSLKKLQKGGEQIAKGNLAYRIDEGELKGDFKAFAATLHSIGDGINSAVEERMKSERFKTELITNVSHDIKTPLTSIINYTDLLSKEDLDNKKAAEYIEVLSRHSARLKKLIEDLMEASKAASGVLSVRKEPCDTGVLLTQLIGEYSERLEQRGLSLVVRKPEAPAEVVADSRHLWRILDNLMSNICKYAQEGTRVYIDLLKQENRTLLVFRNISKAALPEQGEELTERFVRGDRSRNTEGSGLGLSIAKSLCQLQGAELKIETDGDLFKATVIF